MLCAHVITLAHWLAYALCRCLHTLACAGVDLLGSVERLGKPAALLGEAQLPALGEEDLARLLSPAVADAGVAMHHVLVIVMGLGRAG